VDVPVTLRLLARELLLAGRSNSDVVFQCAFRVVWCPKYRRRVLGGRIEERLKELIREVVDEKGAWVVVLEVMPTMSTCWLRLIRGTGYTGS
jgi:hypothetical protein